MEQIFKIPIAENFPGGKWDNWVMIKDGRRGKAKWGSFARFSESFKEAAHNTRHLHIFLLLEAYIPRNIRLRPTYKISSSPLSSTPTQFTRLAFSPNLIIHNIVFYI